LIPSSGGRFEVTVDRELVYSKAATGRHAAAGEIVRLIREGKRS
jgi:selenoprotein W-related protein